MFYMIMLIGIVYIAYEINMLKSSNTKADRSFYIGVFMIILSFALSAIISFRLVEVKSFAEITNEIAEFFFPKFFHDFMNP